MSRRSLPLLAAFLLVFQSSLAAQTTDIITGRVLGPAGETLASASVRATSLETGIQRATITNAQGRYTLVFPEGGGLYQLEVSYLGMAPRVQTVARTGDEDVLVAEIAMRILPIALDGVEVRATRDDGMGPGSVEWVISEEDLNRLLVDPTDLWSIAAMTPGVVALDGDDDFLGGFSVLGQGPSGNQVTLDGISFDPDAFGGMGVPQEAMRAVRMITNSYDVSRGQFSGGQIASTTRSGTNQVQGNVNYSLRDPSLQWTMDQGAFAGAFRQNRLSGGVGGPIIRDRLFYFGSAQVQRRSEGLQSILSADARDLQRLGAHPDSVGRFLDIASGLGLHGTGFISPRQRVNDTMTLLGRIDYNLSDAHTVTVRADLRHTEQDGFRIGSLGLPQSGGTTETTGGGLMTTVTSRFGNGWVNEFRAYASQNSRGMAAYQELPVGRVRVSSDLEDGTRGISTLSFGGSASGMDSRDRTFELSNELSILRGFTHRIRVGGMLNVTEGTQEVGTNRLGTFTFNSLADLEAGRAASFTRALSTTQRQSGGLNAALYAGDTWRATDRLQLTYGARLEGSAVARQPEYNPVIEELFGRRTDEVPADVRVSPRVGFSYTLGSGGWMPGSATVIRGGIGEFRARPPFPLYAAAFDATGLPDAQTQLFCVGAAVPFADWDAFAADPGAIPNACAGGLSEVRASGRGNSVTVFDPDFGAARSWRTSLGFQHQIAPSVGISADLSYALGVSQQGVRDLNLNPVPAFTLPAEGNRPVFAPSSAIVPQTGEIGFLASRAHPQFGQVLEAHSELRSRSTQFTLSVNGMIPQAQTFVRLAYTHGRSQDQGSGGAWGFGRGGAGMASMLGGGMGGSASGLAITGANPNDPEWGRSDFERRHSINATVGRQMAEWLNLTLIGRLSSGAPYTPLVGGDINGDGSRNDRAFVFDPASTADPALAAAMSRLLDTTPTRSRDCLLGQLGGIAERNSCASPWTQSLDVRAQINPNLPGLDRRLSLSVDAVNTLVGLDQLFHGSDDLRGWGQRDRVDPTLLYPRGFDPYAQSFVYEVNERFGAPRQGGNAIRNPFQIQISGRLAVGPQRGDRGGFMGGAGGMMRGGFPGRFGGGGFNPRAMAPQANPITQILALADSLSLAPQQVERLEQISGALQESQANTVAEMQRMIGGAAMRDPATAMRLLQPRINEASQQLATALAAAEEVLTPEQWARLPEDVRQPLSGMAGGGAAQAVLAGGAGRGVRAGGSGGSVGLGMFELPNPITPIIERAEALSLTSEQVERLGMVAATVDEHQAGVRAELEAQLADTSQRDPAAAMRGIQPRLEATREVLRGALAQAEEILTEEQWQALPAELREVRGGPGGFPAGARFQRGSGGGTPPR